MVNLLLNDDQKMPTSAQKYLMNTIRSEMIAMEVARNNDHVYTLGNYCAFAETQHIMMLLVRGIRNTMMECFLYKSS